MYDFDKLINELFTVNTQQKDEIIDSMLSIKCMNLNSKDSNGFTPLHRSILSNDLHTFKRLLDRNVNINVKDSLNRNAIYHVTDNNLKCYFKPLIERKANFTDSNDKCNAALLACERDMLHFMKEFINADEYGNIAKNLFKYIMKCLDNKSIQCLDYILDKYKNDNAIKQCLFKRVNDGDIESIKLMMKNVELDELFQDEENIVANIAVAKKHYSMLYELKELGFPLDTPYNNKTIMYNSIYHENLEVMDILMSCDVLTDAYIIQIIKTMNIDMIKVLVKHTTLDFDKVSKNIIKLIEHKNIELLSIVFGSLGFKFKNNIRCSTKNEKFLYKNIICCLTDDEIVELMSKFHMLIITPFYSRCASRGFENSCKYMLQDNIELHDFDNDYCFRNVKVLNDSHLLIKELTSEYLYESGTNKSIVNVVKNGDLKLLKSIFNGDIFGYDNTSCNLIECKGSKMNLLMIAITINHNDICDFLFNFDDLNIHYCDDENRNALHYACIYNNEYVFNKLISLKLKLNNVKVRGVKYIQYDTLLFMHSLDDIQSFIISNIKEFSISKDDVIRKLVKKVYAVHCEN